MTSSDEAWRRWGKEDAYFGVLSDEKYRRDNLTAERRKEFLASGHDWIDHILRVVDMRVLPGFKPHSALDFGCGVGRLVVPLGQICERVVGVDIAEAMLAEARANVSNAGLTNVEFITSDDELSQLQQGARFDLIHSAHVFQHVPVSRGEAVLKQLISRLNPGGVAVVHFTYYRNASRTRKIVNWLRRRVPLLNGLAQLVQGGRFSEPPMQMNMYSLNELFRILQVNGMTSIYVEFEEIQTFMSAVIYCTRQPAITR